MPHTRRRACERCRKQKLKCDLKRPTCESCAVNDTPCEWESSTGGPQISADCSKILEYLINELGELYQFFHPDNLAALLQSFTHHEGKEKVLLSVMIDALCSLGAYYMGDKGLSEYYYQLAKRTVDSLFSDQLEEMIACAILVMSLAHA